MPANAPAPGTASYGSTVGERVRRRRAAAAERRRLVAVAEATQTQRVAAAILAALPVDDPDVIAARRAELDRAGGGAR